MRAHDHLAIKEKCKNAISELMRYFELGDVISLRTDELGWVNPVFFVNELYVFRFNARDINLPKLQRERLAYKILKHAGLPVPELVIFDDSKKHVPFDVMITRKIEGANIEYEWPQLSMKHKAEISEQAGRLLRQIHNISINHFGELAEKSPLPKTQIWSEYLKYKIEFHLMEAAELSLFKFEQLSSIEFIFKNFKSQLDALKLASFVHVDFHFGNLLHNNFKIVSILDFEWSFAGDPLYDLCTCESMNETWPDSQISFFKGYGLVEFNDEQKQRMKFYQMIRSIELCVVARKHFSHSETKDYLNTTAKQIDSLVTKLRTI